MNDNVKVITNKYLITVEDSREIKYHGDAMSHLMHEYELGEINGTEAVFDDALEELNEHLTELQVKLPEYELELEHIREHHEIMLNTCKVSSFKFTLRYKLSSLLLLELSSSAIIPSAIWVILENINY